MQISFLRLLSLAPLCLLLVSPAFAQSRKAATQSSSGRESSQSFRPALVSDGFNKTFEGTLDNKIKIRMNLNRKGSELSGSYLYEKHGKNIVLRGAINENGYFEIKEYDEKNEENASFHGAFISDEAMVGFWVNYAPLGRYLSFQLIESGKQPGALITSRNSPVKLLCQVKNNDGDMSILMIGDAIIGFEYNNVNVAGNHHTCGLYASRTHKDIVWEDSNSITKIIFTKEYFKGEETAEIAIKKSASRYDITFSGELRYFCGVRAFIPPKVSVYKSGNVWVGKAQYR